jgi:hypothetical protein
MGLLGSFRKLFIPQCSECAAEATDAAGRRHEVDDILLPPDIRQQLTAAGWQIKPGDPCVHRGPADPFGGDTLVCGACTARKADVRAAREAEIIADLSRPRVKVLGLAARLGDGVTLSQRAGDAERHRWLVEARGQVRGSVCRYQRKAGGFSTGWEARYLLRGEGFFRREAIGSCQHRPGSSFLWSSRDLAAWGVLFNPPHHEERPEWATRRKAS